MKTTTIEDVVNLVDELVKQQFPIIEKEIFDGMKTQAFITEKGKPVIRVETESEENCDLYNVVDLKKALIRGMRFAQNKNREIGRTAKCLRRLADEIERMKS
jgi:hypothetical protein